MDDYRILGSASGQFATIDYQPELKERDFYVFPYDMRHTVYPFNGPGMQIEVYPRTWMYCIIQ